MNKQWYYVENGDKKGPYPATELRNKIEKDTLLWCEGMKDWEKAEGVYEFKSFFEVTPPPVPGSKKANGVTFFRISNSILSAYAFAVLTIIICIIELAGHEDWKYYRIAVLMSGTALIRVFLGLRSYFSRILQNNSLSRTMGWLIASVIPLYLGLAFMSEKGFEDRISEEAEIVMIVILFVSFIINIYQLIKLRKKLSQETGIGLKELRTFATLQLLIFPVALILVIIYNEEDTMLIIETIFELIPFYFLIVGLQKIEDRVVPKTA